MNCHAAILLLAGLALFAPATGWAAEGTPALQNRSIGYAMTNREWAAYTTPEGKTECRAINTMGAREQFKVLYPDKGTPRTYLDTAMAYEIQVWFPSPSMNAVVDALPFNQIQGKIAYGLNLDGKIGPKDFTSPEGEKGIDNQFYRASGCGRMFRSEGSISKRVQDEIYNRSIIELTDVDSLTNDDDVTLTTYRGTDALQLDASGAGFLPGGTQHVDARWGKFFVQRFKGKIKDGVLTTEPADVAFPQSNNRADVPLQRFRGLRWRLSLTLDGAQGIAGGYIDNLDFIRQLNKAKNTQLQAFYQISSLSLYRAMDRLADGYPDPRTGRNTAVSAAQSVKFTQVFIVHPEHETTSSAAERIESRPARSTAP